MPGSVARCLACEWIGPRTETNKVNLGTKRLPDNFDQCPACESVDVDVISADGFKYEAAVFERGGDDSEVAPC